MLYGLIAVAVVALTVVFVYLRSIMRRQVASLFRSIVQKLMAGGTGIEPAMQEAIGRFARRPPFNLIKADELSTVCPCAAGSWFSRGSRGRDPAAMRKQAQHF